MIPPTTTYKNVPDLEINVLGGQSAIRDWPLTTSA